MLVIEMHQRVAATRTAKHRFHSVLEGNPLAFGGTTIVEFMALFIIKPNLKFLQNPPLLIQNETLQLVRLELPVKNEPTSVLVS